MCIFTRPSVDVADTRLFARLTDDNKQILVYEMSYGAAEDLAMVLPLPVASRDENTALKFINLSSQHDFFERLTSLIWLLDISESSGDTLSSDSSPVKPMLKVHEVGAFSASFVPSPGDFDRLDARFKLPKEVWSALPQYRDYGFAVFQLRQTSGGLKGVHPMAFEFSTRLTDFLFLPTVHVHDGSFHETAWFDHLVYFQGRDCALGTEPIHFQHGRKLTQTECENKTVELYQRRVEGWKFEQSSSPEKDRFGVCWPAGPSEKLREFRSDAKKLVERLKDTPPEARQAPPKNWRWIELSPILDVDSDLYMLGMSGMLPNKDTLVSVKRPGSNLWLQPTPASGRG